MHQIQNAYLYVFIIDGYAAHKTCLYYFQYNSYEVYYE